MTNIQKAIELINTFATGDTEKAASLLERAIFSTISPMALALMPLSAPLLIWPLRRSRPR